MTRASASVGMGAGVGAAPDRLNIGLSIFVSKNATQSIWSNGAVQNIVFLYALLRSSPQVGELWLINGGDGEKLPDGLMVNDMALPVVKMEDVADRLDVLIEGGAQIPAAHADLVHARGGVVIAYRCGNDYVMDVERLSFDRPSGSIFNGTRFDEIWTHAQHERTCGAYWRIGMRAPLRVMPHIWSPMFLQRAIAELADADTAGRRFGYAPRPGPKRVSIFEPNINVVKSCVPGMLVCEAAHRADRRALSEVYVTNAVHLKTHVTFQNFAGALDIVRDRLASFEARYNLPYFLAGYTDIVVTHQWENGLNYLYYDALYGRYPLVHNSPFLKDVGYFYEGFDAEQGGRALLDAARRHDGRLDEYDRQARALLAEVDIANPRNVDLHVGRLFELLRQKRPAAAGDGADAPAGAEAEPEPAARETA